MKAVENMKAVSRKLAMRDGAYDGRFATQKVKDKKKDLYKKLRKEKHKLRFSF